MSISPVQTFKVEEVSVQIHPSKTATSRAAAIRAASILREVASERARIIIGTGNSQAEMIDFFVKIPDIDWGRIEVFHMDEYVGLPESHPASFRRWVRTRLVNVVHPSQAHYLNGEAADLDQECQRYGDLLRRAAIDLCFLGFGENGHIAFNDPYVADFHDPKTIKRVELDRRCRLQQVGEGHFPNLGAVPAEALTITCPALLHADHLICCVPEGRKAEAVRDALEGPVSSRCPASLVRTHPRAVVYLDVESASLLSASLIKAHN